MSANIDRKSDFSSSHARTWPAIRWSDLQVVRGGARWSAQGHAGSIWGAFLAPGAPSLIGGRVVFWLVLALGVASGVGPPALAGPSLLAPYDVTLYGLSGTMLVPGLDVLPRGMGRAAVHLTGGDAVDQGSFKGVFSFSEDAEVAIMKRFGVGRDQFAYDPILAAKYKVRPSLAVAAVIDTTAGYKDSIMLLSGTPGHRVVLGLGANFAYNGTERHAHFGRYPDRLSPVDNLFFVFGGRLNLDDDTEITMDYAGNDFLVGLRHRFDQNVAFDFGYFLPDRLHPSSRFSLGANFGF